MEHLAYLFYDAFMEAVSPEPEELEREFPGWVVWTTVHRRWYARWLKSPDVQRHAESGEGLRQEIRAWQEQREGEQ